MNKVVFTILIIGLIIGVAGGIYAVLNMSKKKSNIVITLKSNPLIVNVGDPISISINDYATITGTESSNCNLENINSVNTSIPGTYTYTIVCGSEPNSVKETGNIIVSESEEPEPTELNPIVSLNVVYRVINDANPLNPNDFVASCQIAGNTCTEISFMNQESLNQSLSTAGSYNVDLIVADSNGNSKVIQAPLYVVSSAILFNYNCTNPNSENVNGYAATKQSNDLLTVGQSESGPVYLNAGRRIYTYVFTDAADYNKAVGDRSGLIDFDGVSGLATYDDANLTLKISTDLSIDTLNMEAGGSFPTNVSELIPYYAAKGGSCSPILEN